VLLKDVVGSQIAMTFHDRAKEFCKTMRNMLSSVNPITISDSNVYLNQDANMSIEEEYERDITDGMLVRMYLS
jgi:hypothetical protein